MTSLPDMLRLDDRVVVVTGASSGLGVHIAEAMAEAGADVAVAARRASKLATTASTIEQLGKQALAVPVDLSSPEGCHQLAARVIEEFGRIDVLVNNAGVGTAVPASRETPQEFQQVLNLNLNATYWLSQACAQQMQPGSAIINISSVLALQPLGLPQAAYSASKAAVLALTRDLAQQWTGRKGIRVNAIAPGFFKTEMTELYPPGYLDSMMDRTFTQRPGDPRELAAAAVFLASSASGYITGQTLIVDGGLTLG